MSRIIEIVLFLTPLLSFAAWRLVFPSPLPPNWLVVGLSCFVALLLLALLWVRQQDANDANQAYIPAQLRDGRVMPSQKSPPP